MTTMSYAEYEAALDALMAEAERTPFPAAEMYPAGAGRAPCPVPRKLYARYRAIKESDVAWPRWAIRARREWLVTEQRGTTMTTLTSAQRRARADAILAESARSGKGIIAAIETVKSRRLFGETTRRAPVTETTRTAPRSVGKGTKSARQSKRVRRIAEAVLETLTASGAPSLPPGMSPPAKPRPAPKPVAPNVPLHQVDVDQLGALATERLGAEARSPFWRGARESAPAAPIAETEAAALAADLASLSDAGLARVFDAQARRAGHRSPIWAA